MRNWHSQLSARGFDYRKVRDATEPLELTIEKQDVKGSVNGDEVNCTGARCIKRNAQAPLALVGAGVAIVVYSKTRMIRYRHNGTVPNLQDGQRLDILIGWKLQLNVPGPGHKLGKRQGRDENKGTRAHFKPRTFTVAAQLRA